MSKGLGHVGKMLQAIFERERAFLQLLSFAPWSMKQAESANGA
jgi:hypothetical protein